ncbi:MAG: hypothetical protein EXX96DRAFT_551878 [Benjaminiella poitrasii]|nr:MAG: hypothetical protein EXX96DRAFT_551878 [Benjaminiella poitrasii]
MFTTCEFIIGLFVEHIRLIPILLSMLMIDGFRPPLVVLDSCIILSVSICIFPGLKIKKGELLSVCVVIDKSHKDH